MSRILILGAGGHAKVIADILRCGGLQVAGFLDDNFAHHAASFAGASILGTIADYARFAPDGMIIGIGLNSARRQIVETLGTDAEGLWCNAIHPSAVIAESVRLGKGIVVAAGAVINSDAVIGDHTIVNTRAVIEHDCIVGRYAHIAPSAALAGGVQIGEGALIGIGAVAIPRMSVGTWATVGANAAIVRPIPDGVTAKGVPARW